MISSRLLRSFLLAGLSLAFGLPAVVAVNHNPTPPAGTDFGSSDLTIQSASATRASNGEVTLNVTIHQEYSLGASRYGLENGSAVVRVYRSSDATDPLTQIGPDHSFPTDQGSEATLTVPVNISAQDAQQLACKLRIRLHGYRGDILSTDYEEYPATGGVDITSSSGAGNGGGSNNSVDVRYSLGRAAGGLEGAFVYLKSNATLAELFSPSALQTVGNVSVTRDSSGLPQTFVTHEATTTVEIVDSDTYHLHFRRNGADSDFKTVTFDKVTGTEVAGTSAPALFADARWGTAFDYLLPVANGAYEVEMDFAELYHDAVGKAVFDVRAEGSLALAAYDILANAPKSTAHTEVISATVTDEALDLVFSAQTYGAQVSALRVKRGVLALGSTPDPTLYQTERVGGFSYAIPVDNGDYWVDLHFVEKAHTAAGARTFDVSAEGVLRLDDYDIFATAGGANVGRVERLTVTVADGGLDLVLSPVLDQPRLAALRVVNVSTGVVVQAINCGGPSYTAGDGAAYVADAGFTGGTVEAPGDLLYAINCGGPALVADGVSYAADDHFKNGRAYIGTPARLLVTDTPLIKDGSGQVVANTDAIRTFDYAFQTIPHSGQFGECVLSYNDGLRREGRQTVWAADQQSYTEYRTTRDVNGLLLSKAADVFQLFPFGWRRVASVVDPDGVALTTTWTYEEGSANPADPKPAGYGQVKRELSPGGAWTDFFYAEDGFPYRTVRQYLDSTPGDSFNSVTETVTRTTVGAKNIETRVTTIRGVETARRFTLDEDLGDEFIRVSITATVPGAEWNDPSNLFTLTRTADSTHPDSLKRGQTLWTRVANGVVTRHTYASATGGGRTVTSDTGAPASAISLTDLSADPGAILDGTRAITTTNATGETIASSTRDIVSGLVLQSWEALDFDAAGRPTLIGYGDGTTREIAYADTNGSCSSCSGAGASPVSETDRDGIVTTYVYDPLGRRVETTRLGITEKTVYDAAGRVVERLRIGSSGPAISLQKTTYDLAGRVTSTEDALGNVTDYAYAYPSGGGLVTTVTQPAATLGAERGTRIETTYADGRTKEISGTAVSPIRYAYGTWSASGQAGEWTQEIKVGDANAETEWTKTYGDLAGRAVKQEYPAGSGTVAATLAYNEKGQLVRQTDPDGVQTLIAYNAKGQREYTVLDWDRDGVIDHAGLDRITRSTSDVYSKSGVVVRRVTTQVWASDNTNAATTVSVSEQDGYGNQSWQTDSAGAVTSTVVNRTSAGAWTVTTTAPDGSYQVQTYSGGRLVSQVSGFSSQVSRSVSYAYDAHGRVSTQTDARTGAVSFTYSERDEVLSTTANNGTETTTNTYDALGNLLTVTRPDSSVTTNEYHLRNNQLKKTSGSQTYPVEYTYDLHGRMKTMTTWQNAATASSAAVTTWSYDAQRGWLLAKVYPPVSGLSSQTSYTYTSAGREATRTWARTVSGAPLFTTYGYNAAGDLVSTDYSDATPDVAITYTRFGAQKTITDAMGTRSLTYTIALRPDQEQLPAFYGNRILTHSYQGIGTGAVPGRSDGFELGVSGDLDQDHSVIYGYDSAGRLASVTAPHGTYTYGYTANSALRASLAGPIHTTTYAYEPHRDVLATLENKVGATTVSKFDYTVNSLGQRTQRANSGTAFAGASTDVFAYNAKGEVTSATNAALPARDQSFVYDDIGNRKTFTTGSGTTSYTANSLNQYTQVSGFGSQPSYDLDGNQLTTGLGQAYVWDAENRLVAVEPVIPASGDKKVLNTYDSQSRRVRRQVFTYSSGAWALTSDEKFIYDGWNVVAVYDATSSLLAPSSLLRAYTWGLDLSGSLQGAGGVGGLLAVKDGSAVYHYTYDANGNVSEVLDSTGAIAAHYEYTSFGDTDVASGAYATANEYRFSTKPLDATRGLYYYGFRYYNASMGRWLSRDPIEERGGPNLYGMVRNETVNRWDRLGMIGLGPPGGPGNIDITGSRPDPSDGLSYMEGAENYFGNGGDVDVPFSEIDQGFGVRDFFDPCQYSAGTHTIDERKGHDLYTIGNFMTIAGPGRVVFRLEGTLIIDGGCWSFDGRTAAYSDRFDFDPRPWGERPWYNELVTRVINALPGGTSYWVDFPGDRKVKEKGGCNQ